MLVFSREWSKESNYAIFIIPERPGSKSRFEIITTSNGTKVCLVHVDENKVLQYEDGYGIFSGVELPTDMAKEINKTLGLQ